MGNVTGERSVEVEAPIERCFEIAADVERAPDWQDSLRDAEVLERDGDRRPALVETESDAKVKKVSYRLEYSYDEPERITWDFLGSDVRDIDGSFEFELTLL